MSYAIRVRDALRGALQSVLAPVMAQNVVDEVLDEVLAAALEEARAQALSVVSTALQNAQEALSKPVTSFLSPVPVSDSIESANDEPRVNYAMRLHGALVRQLLDEASPQDAEFLASFDSFEREAAMPKATARAARIRDRRRAKAEAALAAVSGNTAPSGSVSALNDPPTFEPQNAVAAPLSSIPANGGALDSPPDAALTAAAFSALTS